MAAVTAESWRGLPERAASFAELEAHAVEGVDGALLAVDHEGTRHLLIGITEAMDPVRDERSRGIRALTRPLSVQGQPERSFIDVICTSTAGHDVFNQVASAIVDQLAHGAEPPRAVMATLARWRRFWGTAPEGGLSPEEIRGLFGELWFLAVWLLPHGAEQLAHWMGPLGARHDFQWPALAIEAKTTASARGHLHRINGLDQLEPPASGELQLFSLRLREEATATNSLMTLVDQIVATLGEGSVVLDQFELRLNQAGYSPLDRDRYAEMRFRIVDERLYRVMEGFPRLSPESFVSGVPAGVERVEYEVNLDACPTLVVTGSPADFSPPVHEATPSG